jgi:flagellar hook-associated protein 2
MAGDVYIGGLSGTGFDGAAMAQQILQLRAIPLQKLQVEKQEVDTKLSYLGQLYEKVNSFYDFFSNLNVEDLFLGKKATVSNTDAVSVSVTESAPNIEFSVTVNQLAQGEIRVSNGGLSNLTDTFASSGTLTISYNTGSSTESFSINYSAGQTIEELVNAINSAQDRVKASVYYDGTKYSLMLSEQDLGASTVETDTNNGVYVISVSGLPSELGTGLDTLQNARNAKLTIGSGTPVSSPTNTFENVISGITIKAKDLASSTVKVDDNYSKVSSFLNDFAENYNSLVNMVDALTSGEDALFIGENTITNLKYGMANRLDPLIELGVLQYDGDTGKISIDSSKLSQLLSSEPDRVKDALSSLKTSFEGFLEVQSNTFKGFKRALEDRSNRLGENIQALAERLAREEILLRREFARLEAFISDADALKQRFQQFMVSLSEIGGDK